MSESPEFEIPMFPLGSVLFPGGVLPLHIFEIRFQQLLNDALESDRRFGVVLISRGSEVGGGETRNDIGTFARIDEHSRFDDGRAAVVCTGTSRFEVVEWLDDAPYPRAMVRELAAEPEARNDVDLLRAAQTSFDDLMGLAHRVGRLESIPESDWAAGLDEATWQLVGRSPFTPLDQYAILAAPSRAERLIKLAALLTDVYVDLELMGGLDGSAD